jgi:preprotein translocase subunit SecY
VGNRVYGGESTHMPLKLNTSGVIPPIFASALLLLPLTILNFGGQAAQSSWLADTAALLGHGTPLYMALYAALIIFFAFFYTAIVFNPMETADNLRKNGAFIPGIRPGRNTAMHLDAILTRLTGIGALYLTAVCLMPEFLIAEYGIPYYFGGTSLLIVVTVTIDTVTQVQSHLLAHQYEGLIRKTKLKGKGR